MRNTGTRKKIGILGLIILPIIICTLLLPSSILADGEEWPQFHGDPQLSGYTTSSAPHTNNLLWESGDIGAAPASSVAVAEGKVFVNCADYIRCLDASTGAEIWSQPIEGGTAWGSWTGPAYDDGKVFIQGNNVYAFDAATGTPLWVYTMDQPAVDGCVLAVNGRVYAGSWEGNEYYCLDANSTDPEGTLLWSFPVPKYAQGTPSYYDDGGDGLVFFTSWIYPGGNVYCVNAVTGDLIWHGQTALDTCGSASIADGKVWVTNYNFYGWGSIMAFDINDLNSDGIGDMVWGPITIERSDSTPAYHDGKIYVCGGCVGYSDEGERTYCIDVATQTIDWQTPVGSEAGALDVGNWTCSVAVADGLVFVGKPNHGSDPMQFDYQGIYALDAATGEEVWHYDYGGASPAIAYDTLFTVGGGKVWAFKDTIPAWDVNQDGSVNVLDMSLVGDHFGETGTPGWIPEDVNSDGSINVLDMSVIGDHFGE